MKNIVIVGGGFAGVWAAMSAAAERHAHGATEIEITLLNRDEFLTIRPRLYEVPSSDMRVPLLPMLSKIGVQFVETTALSINASDVGTEKGSYSFDRLVLASGSHLRKIEKLSGLAGVYSVDTFDQAA